MFYLQWQSHWTILRFQVNKSMLWARKNRLHTVPLNLLGSWEVSVSSFNTTVMHLVKKKYSCNCTCSSSHRYSGSVCPVAVLPDFMLCLSPFIQDVLWCPVILFLFFNRGTQPHHLSLLSDLCVVHVKAYACISRCDAALLLSRCVFSVSLFTVDICGCGFGPWRDPF